MCQIETKLIGVAARFLSSKDRAWCTDVCAHEAAGNVQRLKLTSALSLALSFSPFCLFSQDFQTRLEARVKVLRNDYSELCKTTTPPRHRTYTKEL